MLNNVKNYIHILYIFICFCNINLEISKKFKKKDLRYYEVSKA